VVEEKKDKNMNGIKHLVLKPRFISNGLRNVFKSTVSKGSDFKMPVRTPFTSNIEVNKSSMMKLNWISRNNSSDFAKRFQNLLPKYSTNVSASRETHDNAGTTIKKRPGFRKKRSEQQEQMAQNGYFTVNAYATAEEYELEKLLVALKTQDLYEPKKFFNSDDNSENEPDVLHATAKYKVGAEPRDIYFFREGTVVMWNCSDMESSNVLNFLKDFEEVMLT
jgi:uncharacterized Rmd1/YagE family protein